MVAVVACLDTGLVQIGTGYLVTERWVLTARQCTADERTGRPARSLRVIRRSDGAQAPATLSATRDSDVAVLTVGRVSRGRSRPLLSPPGSAAWTVGRSGELHDCEAAGFPLWQLDPRDQQRKAAELHGTIQVTEDVESGLW